MNKQTFNDWYFDKLQDAVSVAEEKLQQAIVCNAHVSEVKTLVHELERAQKNKDKYKRGTSSEAYVKQYSEALDEKIKKLALADKENIKDVCQQVINAQRKYKKALKLFEEYHKS
jgi:hypothetical protein